MTIYLHSLFEIGLISIPLVLAKVLKEVYAKQNAHDLKTLCCFRHVTIHIKMFPMI
jgi:hypothetical protein